MITRDGFAKVLDFGLAKLVEGGTGFGQSTDSNVATEVMKQHSTPGVVMGTVGYMSPEQAKGKTNEIDQRSDIFSFGCILFEAVTGQRAFAGQAMDQRGAMRRMNLVRWARDQHRTPLGCARRGDAPL
jgi:serine/threonine protein kinase